MRNSIPRRGLQNMQTRASRKVAASLQSPELYIKLTSLEIERSRRAVELASVVERVKKLSERIQSIANEQDALKARIANQQQVGQQQVLSTLPSAPDPSRTRFGFTY